MEISENIPKWYALYTKSRTEKKVAERLNKIGVEYYLPLKKTLKQWSDRKKYVFVPIINSYIFVKVKKEQLYDLIAVEGITRYISFSGRPVEVRQQEIDVLKLFLESGTEVEFLDGEPKKGKLVKFTSGIFKDYKGKILKVNRKNQLVVEIESLGKSLIVNIELENIILA